MDSISFIGNSEPPDKLLEIFRKLTPGKSGCWKNLKGEPHYETDYYCVIDYLPNHLRGRIKEDKCIFLGAHPESMQAYRDMTNYKCLAKADCKYTLGFLETWIKYDYDYLMVLQPPVKTKALGTIVSNARSQLYHQKRLDWIRRFASTTPSFFDLYGRIEPEEIMKPYYRGVCGSWDARGAAASGGNDHMSGKETVYETHKYMIEFDAIGSHYFSERLADCLLLWAFPIYWGGTQVHQYLPQDSFRYLEIEGEGLDVREIINSGVYENNLHNIHDARQLILNKWQIWPRIHSLIYNGVS